MDANTEREMREFHRFTGLPTFGAYKKKYARRTVFHIFAKANNPEYGRVLAERTYDSPLFKDKPRIEIGKFKHGANILASFSRRNRY